LSTSLVIQITNMSDSGQDDDFFDDFRGANADTSQNTGTSGQSNSKDDESLTKVSLILLIIIIIIIFFLLIMVINISGWSNQ